MRGAVVQIPHPNPEEPMPRSTTMTVAAFAAIAACALAAPAASQVVTTAGGDVVSTAQKHLIDNLITIDSIQAATAKMAATKTENPAVRDFANSLASDHAAHADALAKIAAKKDVGREADASSKIATDFSGRYTALESAPAGAEFDRAFLQAVVANHQAEIAAINSGKASAGDEDLKKDLDQTVGGLQSHLAKANELSATVGKAGAAPAKPPM
jgi:putative membrane protein